MAGKASTNSKKRGVSAFFGLDEDAERPQASAPSGGFYATRGRVQRQNTAGRFRFLESSSDDSDVEAAVRQPPPARKKARGSGAPSAPPEAMSPGADFDIHAFLAEEERKAREAEEASLALARQLAGQEDAAPPSQPVVSAAPGKGKEREHEDDSEEASLALAMMLQKEEEAAAAQQQQQGGSSGAGVSESPVPSPVPSGSVMSRQDRELHILAKQEASLALARKIAEEEQRVAEWEALNANRERAIRREMARRKKDMTKEERQAIKERQQLHIRNAIAKNRPELLHQEELHGLDGVDEVDPRIVPPELLAEHMQALEQMWNAPARPPPPAKAYKPYFIGTVTGLNILLLIISIIVNGGFESPTRNPWGGPSIDTLILMGAKWGPPMAAGEVHRFVVPILLHVGIVHIAFNGYFQATVGRQLEERYGMARVAPIYVLSGISGNLVSVLFLPDQVQVGASGALYGFLGVLLTDLIQNWANIVDARKHLMRLILSILISLSFGLLPAVDNFAHLGGLIVGTVAGVVWIPPLMFGFCTLRRKAVIMYMALPFLVVWFVLGFTLFYVLGANGTQICEPCYLLNCIPISGVDWCSRPDSD